MAELEFIISCDYWLGKNIVKHNSTSSVLAFKKRLEYATCIPIDEQKLYIDEQELENTKNLNDYNIKNKTNIRLIGKIPQYKKYNVLVKTNCGTIFAVYSNTSDTISDILHHLQDNENSSVSLVDDYNTFNYGGQTLDHNKSLEYYKIGNNATIYHYINARCLNGV